MRAQVTSAQSPLPSHPVAWRVPRWAWLLAAYVLAWSALPALLAPSLPLDVVEGIAWGHEWQWGYYKHPSVPAWLLYPAYQGLGKFGPYLLGQLAIVLALYYVWRLAREMLDAERATLAALLLYAIYYNGWPTLEFNHNIAQIPVWAALGWHGWRAFSRGAWCDWVWLGVWAGLGWMTKYSTAVFMACVAAYLVLGPQRRLLRQPGPWLAALVALVVAAPNLLWLLRHDGLPFVYLEARSSHVSLAAAGLASLHFLAAQAVAHAPLLVILLAGGLLKPGGWHLHLREPGQRGWLYTIALAPTLLTLLYALMSGADLHDMWGTPMWNFSPLLLLALMPAQRVRERAHALRWGLALWMAGITLAMAAYVAFGAQWRGRPARMDWPAQAIAAQAAGQWQRQSSCPLRVVAGDYWLAGLVAEGARPQASILIAGDARFSPWVTPQRLRQQGALLVWQQQGAPDGPPTSPPSAAPLTQMPAADWHVAEGLLSVPWPRNTGGAPLLLRWRAYVPPDCVRAAGAD